MITRFTPIEEMKQIFYEMLFNHTNKVTKVSDQSALNGIAYGVAKIAQKANKEIALIESHLFAESAFGDHLDQIAARRGVSERFGASKSTTFIRIVANPGTSYSAVNQVFTGNGISFKLEQDIIIPQIGYIYARVYSETTGSKSNIPPLAISTVSPSPEGHIFVTNEYKADGGRDIESDELFRSRIRKGVNTAAKTTLDSIALIFQKINKDVLSVRHYGMDNLGRTVLSVITQTGSSLNSEELLALSSGLAEYVSLSDYSFNNASTVNIVIRNIEYSYIDISIRADVLLDQPLDQTRIQLQVDLSKEVDFRNWKSGDKVEWDNLLQIVKSHKMIRYVSDADFHPKVDVEIDINKLPRIRGFILMDLEGNVLIDNNQTINPVFYPATADFGYQQTVLTEAT